MFVSCASCGTQYTVADERLQSLSSTRSVKVRCQNCHTPIVVTARGSVAPVAMTSSHAAFSQDSGSWSGARTPAQIQHAKRNVTGMHFTYQQREPLAQWYAVIGGRARGPFTPMEMLLLAEKGKVREGTHMWKQGLSTWHKSSDEVWNQDDHMKRVRKTIADRKMREHEALQHSSKNMHVLGNASSQYGVRTLEFQEPTLHNLNDGAAVRVAPVGAPHPSSLLPGILQISDHDTPLPFEWRAPVMATASHGTASHMTSLSSSKPWLRWMMLLAIATILGLLIAFVVPFVNYQL